MAVWKPLNAPEENHKTLLEWRELLECKQIVHLSTLAAPEPWGKLLWHAWVPYLRFAAK